jgi:DNA-binding LytR/AlgR family response regulator
MIRTGGIHMHVAVCDDNIADRKQSERLLGRVSDQFLSEGREGLFIDSFGNVESLMHTPQMYDALFIDMVSDNAPNGIEIARMLRKSGVTGQIILISSIISYPDLVTDVEKDDFHFIDKPLHQKDLHQILDYCEQQRASREPLVELRDDYNTVYARGEDIYYAHAADKGILNVRLEDGRNIRLLTSISNFYDLLGEFDFLIPASEETIDFSVITGRTNVSYIFAVILFVFVDLLISISPPSN